MLVPPPQQINVNVRMRNNLYFFSEYFMYSVLLCDNNNRHKIKLIK